MPSHDEWLKQAKSEALTEEEMDLLERLRREARERELMYNIGASHSPSYLAMVTRKDWPTPYFGAVPYLQAMATMYAITDSYGMDDGRSIITYFLSNAGTWRGPVARAVKARLNFLLRMDKQCRAWISKEDK